MEFVLISPHAFSNIKHSSPLLQDTVMQKQNSVRINKTTCKSQGILRETNNPDRHLPAIS